MTHVVVINHELQHSIWPADEPVPTGWRPTGFRGRSGECLDEIARVWTDLLPNSVRRPALTCSPE